MNDNNINLFFNTFINCMLYLNSLQIKLSFEENSLKESNIIKNLALNWLIDLLNMIKCLIRTDHTSKEQIIFSIKIFIAFIYSWSNKLEFNYNELKLESFKIEKISKNFHLLIIKFLNHSYCKQFKNKIIEWFISIQMAYDFGTNFNKVLKGND
jgi:hypothetical protein